MKKLIYSALAIILTFANTAKAVENSPFDFTPSDKIENDSVLDFSKLFMDYVGYAINLFWVLIIVYGFFAAFKYLTAKGDPKAADVASQMFKYTVIAACVALLATVIKEIAKSILGG